MSIFLTTIYHIHSVFLKRTFCSLVLCLFITNSHSQNLPTATQKRIDSLKTELLSETVDTNTLKILNSINLIYVWSAGFEDSAIKYARITIDITDKAKCNPYWKGNALSILGIKYSSYPPEALKYHFEALKLRRQIQDKRGIAACLHNISLIYSTSLGYYDEAIKFSLEALKIREELKDSFYIIASYINLGDNYFQAGKYIEALKYFTIVFNSKNAKSGKVLDYGLIDNIGKCHCNLGNYNEGFKFLNMGLKIVEDHYPSDINGIARMLISIGNCNAKLASMLKTDEARPKFSEALLYLNKGLTISPPHYGSRKEAYFGLGEVYKGLNEYEKALQFSNMHRELVDSLSSKEIQYRIDQLRIQYETELITLEEKSKREKILLEQRALHEKILADQKIRQEVSIVEEKKRHELALNQEKFLKEKQLGEEKSKYDKSIALEKARQEKSKLEKQRINNLLLVGISAITIISCLLFLLFRQRVIKRRAIEKAESHHRMAELELQSLRAQLNPHFMFNSLNAIQELILKEDNDNSHLYLSKFSELLRMLLDNANQPFVSLRKELKLLELYLSLEQLRIPDLKYSIEIDSDVDVNTMTIPNMMLQPYIENAIWHGLSHKKGDKNLFIRINKNGDGVICKVEDNGVGRKVSSELKSLYRKEHRSKGMELLSKRFNLLSKEYGSDIQTDIEDLRDNGTATGTRVSIILPHSLTAQSQPIYS